MYLVAFPAQEGILVYFADDIESCEQAETFMIK